MAAVDVGARNVPPMDDDLDNLFNYEIDNDLLREVDTNMDAPPRQHSTSKATDGALEAGLGLDEEIKITRRRAPIPKLDENRLLSQAGIPKLRRIAKERLRFKGKGHEYSDVARLLNFYQLWLDDLYPRAKFADGLAIIEKLGHTKRMQTMRKEWINEGKAKHSIIEDDEKPEISASIDGQKPSESAEIQINSRTEDCYSPGKPDGVHQVFGATDSIENGNANKKRSEDVPADDSLFISDGEDTIDNVPEGDDLDALLAEDDAAQKASAALSMDQNADNNIANHNFNDEEEAMVGMDDFW